MKITASHTVTTATPAFLNNGGAMGKLTREYDWAATPLGDPESWPQSLKTIVSVILNSRFPMFLWWGDDMIQFYNDAYRPSLGNSGKHPLALGQKGEDCWPEIWPIIKPLIDQVRGGGGATWSEDQLIPIYRNGQLEDVYWTFGYSPVMNEEGNINGVLVVCNETTEKVKNLLALAESEDKLRFAIEATELGTWDYNPHTDKLTGNLRLKEWFGLHPHDEVDLPVAVNVIMEKDQPAVIEAIAKALDFSSGGSYDIQYAIVHPVTKTERIVRAKGKAWFNEDKVAYRFNGTLQDITDTVVSFVKTRDAEERARLAIESADLGTYEINLLTDEMKTSERFNTIWGVNDSMLRPEFAAMIHPEDRAMRDAAHEESIASGRLFYEARIIHPDESVHWVRVNGKVLYNASGKAHYLLGVIKDITAQKERERHKDDFISIVSHELKTPLTSLFGFSQLMAENPAMLQQPQLSIMLGRMHGQVKRLNYILQDLVDVTRIEGNKIRFREDRFDVSVLLAELIEEIQHINPTHRILLTCIDNAEVFADKERIGQVITNFLTNAIKYSPKGSVVSISAYKEGDEIICSVKDDGHGIAPDKQTMIFERFYQVPVGNQPNAGLGLGLYISSQIIKRQKGRIWLESEPGRGSTFYFSLPVNS
ncbi:MAG: ATP-binding protein [Chitinophagaceae bacterium]